MTHSSPTMAAAANATTTRIGTHLGRRELMLGFMESLLAMEPPFRR